MLNSLIEENRLSVIFGYLWEAVTKSIEKHGTYNSAHEAYAVLKEEVDELWDNVKLKHKIPERRKLIRDEAMDIALVAVRIIYDLTDEVS